MIASSTLHLTLAASLTASPTADPSTCAPSDHRCTAEANVTAARAATSDGERVHRLYRAHRAYLALARKAAPAERARPLCRAAELLGQVRRLQPPESLRESLVDTAKETVDALTVAGIDCSPPKKQRKTGRRVATRTSPATETTSATTTASAADEENRPAANESVLLGVRARSSATHAVAPSPTPGPERPGTPVASSPRDDAGTSGMQRPLASSEMSAAIRLPGRPLIGGGVTMAAGLVLGGAAAYLGTRASHARQAGIDLAATETGAAAREQGRALQDEYRTYGTFAVAGAVVGGAAVLTGVVMLVVGHHRNARAHERNAIILPTRTGLLLSVKF